jgi:hypothetical protein
MSTSVASAVRNRDRTFQPSFFFWMTLVMAFFVFTGFGMTYWIPLASGTFPPAPPIVHFHGFVFFTWMILLIVQASLVSTGNVTLHRRLGTYGIAHATVILYTGALIQLLGVSRAIANGGTGPFDAAFLGLMAVIGFGLLFTLAIRNVRRPEAHKRLILFAMLPILPPGVNRFYQVPFGLDYIPVLPLYLTLNAMALAILVQEWRSTGKIGKYSMIGAGFILMQSLVHVPIVQSDVFLEGVRYVAGLIHYR